MDFTDEQIKEYIESMEKKKKYACDYYCKRYKENEDYKKKVINTAKQHYLNNKEKRADNYQKNKERYKAKSKYNYYKKVNKIDLYFEKFKEEYDEYIKVV